MRITGITIQTLTPEDRENPGHWLIRKLVDRKITLQEKSILVLSSKILAYLEGRVIRLSNVKATPKAKRIAQKWGRDEKIMQLILQESDEILHHNHLISLCKKKNIYSSNAGIDTSNVPKGFIALWPKDPMRSAAKIRRHVKKIYKVKNLGIIIADSICLPGRRGTMSIAIGYAGVSPLKNWVKKRDLYNKPFHYSSQNMVDSLATAANIMMGEGTEKTPLILIEDAPVRFTEKTDDNLSVDQSEDMFKILLTNEP